MKLCMVLIVVAFCLVLADAGRIFRTKPCVNCHGKLVSVNAEYFDGCNNCKCKSHSPRRATCRKRGCLWNMCHKVFRPKPCKDCYGKTVSVNAHYFDGCNKCKCTSHNPYRAGCTKIACFRNRCPPRKG